MLAYPFYLWKRSPGKEGSHYDPKCDLFTPAEEPLVSHIYVLSRGVDVCTRSHLRDTCTSTHVRMKTSQDPLSYSLAGS